MIEFVTAAIPSPIRSGATMLLALTVAGVFSVLISITVARSISVADFGAYSIVVSIQSVVSIFAGFSIGPAMAKYVAEHRVRNHSYATQTAIVGLMMVLVFSVIACAVYIGIAPLLGNELYNEPLVKKLIPFSALTVFSNALHFATYGIVQGYQRIKFLGLMHILTPLLTLIGIPFLMPAFGIGGVFLAYFFSQMIVTGIAWLSLLKGRNVSTKLLSTGKDFRLPKKVLGFAIPGVLSSSMLGPVLWLANTELAIDAGFEAMGYFAVAFVFYQAMLVIPRSVVIPLIPKISELSVKAENEIERVVVESLRFIGVVLFPLMFAVALFANEVVELLYGSYYVPAGPVVYLMMTAAYFYTMASVVGAVLSGKGRMWLAFSLNGIWAGVFLVMAYIAIQSWGLWGMGVAFAGSYTFHMALSYAVSTRILGIRLTEIYSNVALASALFFSSYILMEGIVDWNWRIGAALLTIGTFLVMIEGRHVVRNILTSARLRLLQDTDG